MYVYITRTRKPEPGYLNLSIVEFTIYDATGSTTRSKFQLKNER
jgi:hypothetical protein